MSDVKAVVIGGLIAAASGAAAQYLISYKLIEAPRLEIENKRLALEATNQMQRLIPVVESECSAVITTKWQYRIVCNFKNRSSNPIWISLSDISVISKNEPKEIKYPESSGYKVEYPNNRRRYLSFPESDGYIDAYLTFDQRDSPNGLNTDKIVALASYEASTHPGATETLVSEFSELKDYAEQITTASRGIVFNLPTTATK